MTKKIETLNNDKRMSTQELMYMIWNAVDEGCNDFEINASGQHNIGGSLWSKSGEAINFRVSNPGQRVGAMGAKNTNIYVDGPAPADVGWLNSGATIVVDGDAGDTTAHCAASGKIFIGGRVGTRSGALMKCDPKFDAPELWVLKNTASFSFEFMGGGIAVVCGIDCDDVKSVLGDRACVGMVGGVVYFRGPVLNVSDDVYILDIDEKDKDFLHDGLKDFLGKINREDVYEELINSEWKKIVAKTYEERKKTDAISIKTFREKKWMSEIGGSIFTGLVEDDYVTYDLVQTGERRLKIPKWKNYAYSAPCEYNCPVKIPTQKRFSLLRQGKIKEALELVLEYSPFPASVCGQVCPNLCLNECSRWKVDEPLDVKMLGQLSADIKIKMPKSSKIEKIAVIGAGVSGLSASWQLLKMGYEVELFEQDDRIGGKLSQVIPQERLPEDILKTELERFNQDGLKINLNCKMTKEKFEQINRSFNAIVLAIGAHSPIVVPFEGYERLIKGLDFLKAVKKGKKFDLGEKVVVIGAGNAAMDMMLEAYHQGAKEVFAIDIKQPSAFEKEIKMIEGMGGKILWPCYTEKITEKGVVLKDGTLIEADSVIISIGDRSVFDFLDKQYLDEKSKVSINEFCQSEYNSKVFVVGDAIKCGLFTNAIADGRNCALNVQNFLDGKKLEPQVSKSMIPEERIKSEYYECYQPNCDNEQNRCLSCGYCRDCGLCLQSCPNNAITRIEKEDGRFEYVSDDSKCIGCGICEGLCPCGIWEMQPNV